MEPRDYKLNLWKEFMEQTPYISPGDREAMGRIAAHCVDDTRFLSRMYTSYMENERFLSDKESAVQYERDGEDCILSFDGTECVYQRQIFKKVLSGMLDLLEDTLPLGTVVDLKKSVYRDIPEIQEVEKIRLVITHRFLGREDELYYFPYAGVIYPTGMMGRKEVLYFTRPLVEKVVREGFRDEEEDAYVYLMKRELVVEKGKNSIGFASQEEIESFNKRIREGEGSHGRG